MREQFKLKPISKEAIPRAVQKAERYRLLNQSWAAESICRDILEIDPTNQQVLVMLVLALTDQLATGHATLMKTVHETLPRLTDPYQRAYYMGIASERCGQAHLLRGGMGSGSQHDQGTHQQCADGQPAGTVARSGAQDETTGRHGKNPASL